MSGSIRNRSGGGEPSSAAPAEVADAGQPMGVTNEVEVRRSVWRLLARELSEPSEEFVSFIAGRLEMRPCGRSAGELTRRALQEFAGVRWALGERQGPRASGRGRKRATEPGSLPGYYLG